MENSRMSNADMIQYCNEALAWEEFGPVDIFFFESVKKILLGQCSVKEPDEINDLMGIERPVRTEELEPEYGLYADEYYTEDEDSDEAELEEALEDSAFSEGFFDKEDNSSEKNADDSKTASGSVTETDGAGFTVKV